MQTPKLPIAAAALLVLALAVTPWCANAQGKAAFNATRLISSPLPSAGQVNMSPYSMPADCTVEGVCVPFTFTLANRTVWSWCGWYSDQRTDYLIKATGTVGAQLMRASTLKDCKLSSFGTCEAIFNSGCGGRNCTMRVLALAYRDEVCLVIGNADVNKSISVDMQVFQYYDSPRYYGTIFMIIMAILMIGGVSTWIGFMCYREITTPPDRLGELRSFEAQLVHSKTILADSPNGTDDGKVESSLNDASDPGSFQGRVKTALGRAKNLVMRRGAGSHV